VRAIDWRDQEVFGAGLDGAHAGGNVAVPGQEHDRQPVSELRQAVLELRPGQARHLHVEQNAIGHAGRRLLQQLLRGLVERHFVAGRVQEPCDRGPERRIVVDDMNDV